MSEEIKTEAVAEKPAAKKAPVKKAAPKAAPKAETKPEPKPDLVWFESREKEPTMFPVAGINPIRNFSTGRLEWRVKADDVARFEQNHFVTNGRVKRKV